ncbi:MAG: LysE family translocator, partial [Kiritimatiellae bacterium]|nr:LysE family translocator [Kiritimatiellia bacterium]
AKILKNGAVSAAVGLAGGAIMCWMGYGMLAGARRTTIQCEGHETRTFHPCVAGILISLANPYWTLWWVTIGLGYLAIGLRLGLSGVAAFFVGHILADLVWYSTVSVGTARGRRLMSERAYRWLIAACGVIVLGFGVWFLGVGFCSAYAAVLRSPATMQNTP